MFKVIHDFKDLQDKGKIYKVGDKYPRKGYDPTEKRIAELLGKKNKIGKSLIKEIEEPKKAAPKKKANK